MEILAASDLHGNHDTYAWLAEQASSRKPEAVVLAGDLLGFPDGFDAVEDAQRQDAGQVRSLLEEIRVPVFFVMGNDDWVELEPRDDRLRPLHMHRIQLGAYNFVGYQYTLPFMGGVNERPEEAIARDLDSLERLLDRDTVLVTHGPAHGTLDHGLLGKPVGSVSLREMLSRRPVRAHIHGHIHSCFGREGNSFNVAAGRSRRAMLIDVDTLSHEILEVSASALR